MGKTGGFSGNLEPIIVLLLNNNNNKKRGHQQTKAVRLGDLFSISPFNLFRFSSRASKTKERKKERKGLLSLLCFLFSFFLTVTLSLCHSGI